MRCKEWALVPGVYVYSGSALNGLAGRIERHRRVFLSQGIGAHWHIDALLSLCGSVTAVCAPSEERTECKLVATLASDGMEPVAGFGSTDCRSGCAGHLLRSVMSPERTVEAVARAFRDMRLQPYVCGEWMRPRSGSGL
ncbi:MAG: DUF123 domain-containing protein [Candidatus Methanosuratus sp.]|nr:DUF123 domain-containing protein [Candidatus Methanosuratincola sp.]